MHLWKCALERWKIVLMFTNKSTRVSLPVKNELKTNLEISYFICTFYLAVWVTLNYQGLVKQKQNPFSGTTKGSHSTVLTWYIWSEVPLKCRQTHWRKNLSLCMVLTLIGDKNFALLPNFLHWSPSFFRLGSNKFEFTKTTYNGNCN